MENLDSAGSKQVVRFFSIWFFLGVIILLFGVILDLTTPDNSTKYIYSILVDFCKTLGIALLISNIFNFVLGTQKFINFIRDKLINIIISKDFIHRLSTVERRDMLKIILKPPKELSSIYSGINEYFNRYIEASLSLFKLQYRSGYLITAEASYDQELQKVKVESDYNHRIYKVMGKYEKLPMAFEEDDSELLFTKLSAPTGEEEIITKTIKTKKDALSDDEPLKNDPSIKDVLYIEIPEAYKAYDRLDVSRRIIEYGEDHWQLFSYRATQPCDKLFIIIRCHDGLKIKKVVTYGPDAKFIVENMGCKVTISCNSWLEPGFGVSVLISGDDGKSSQQSVPESSPVTASTAA
ncbi:hypothetical protein ACFL43_02940 [Thermodesulfobacteriota bacterium]